jgi:hypothetical protein
MEGAIQWKMAICFSEDLAAAEQERYAIGRVRVVAGSTGVFEAMSDSVTAEEKFVNNFAQLDGYCQEIRGIHGVLSIVFGPANHVGWEKRGIPRL